MTLPPLANLVAVRREGATEWAVETFPFPKGEPDGPDVRAAGLFFAEGRERVDRGWADLVRLVREAPHRLGEVPGDVGFLHLTPEGDATVVRSASGRVPFYIARSGGALTIATTLDLIARHHPGPLTLDPLVNAIWTSGFGAYPDRRSFLAEVTGPRRGEHAVVRGDRVTFGRHWSPRARAGPRVNDEHPERLRELLLGTLERELDRDGDNLCTLSGGVDSSAVAALAHHLGRPTSTLTALTPSEPERSRDLGYIDHLAETVPFTARSEIVFDADRRLDALDAPGVPFHVTQPFLGLMPEVAAQRPISVVYGGEIADNLIGSTLTRFDWARHTTPLGLWRERGRLPLGWVSARKWATFWARRAARRPLVPFAAGLPALVRPELRAEYDEWLRGKRRAAARDRGPMPYLAQFMEREGFLGMHWEVTSALGIRRCHPFVTREMLELAFEMHPHELIRRGETKRPLRQGLAGIVPPRNLQRGDKGDAGRRRGLTDRPWELDLPGELSAVLADGQPATGVLPYWDVYRLRQLRAFVRALRQRTGT